MNNNGYNKLNNNQNRNNFNNNTQPQSKIEKYFINPYNFIPLSNNPVKKGPVHPGELTGYIDCQLTLQTPLIVVDTDSKREINDNADNPTIFDSVFTIDGKMAIPGSELRGMIRSKYETLTNSCLSKIDDELTLYGRGKAGINQPGLLEYETGTLYEAESICVYLKNHKYRDGALFGYVKYNGKPYEDFSKLKTGDEVQYSEDGKGSWQKGILRIGNPLGIQEAVHVFVKKVNGKSYQDDNLKRVYTQLAKDSKGHKSICKTNLRPVWYGFRDSNATLGSNSEVYISLGQNGRVEFKRKIEDAMAIKNKTYKHCMRENELCETCSVFGTIAKDRKTNQDISIAGRVRFEDAIGPEYKNDGKYYALSELASPKVNPYFYFFTEDPAKKKNEYNIDFKYHVQGPNATQEENDDIIIRGRKEYWHHPINGYKILNSEEVKQIENYFKNRKGKGNGAQENYVRKVITKVIDNKANPVFNFRVYYRDLTKDELDHLVGALALQDGNKKLSHKLGMAKPYGFGSVQVKVNYIASRKNKDQSYSIEKKMFDSSEYSIAHIFKTLAPQQLSSIRNIYNFDYIQENIVSYPYLENKNSKIFEWFMDHKAEKLPFSMNQYDMVKQSANGKPKNKKSKGPNNARKNHRGYQK